VNELLYKLGLRLARFKYVERAIAERANLSQFRRRPTFRIIAGVSLICVSMLMSWPILVAVLGGLAIKTGKHWIAVLIIPLYILSHVMYIAGMFLSGEKFVRIFFRWGTRCSVEWLLSYAPAKDCAPPKQPAEL
jgi:hypothetical protein